VWDGTSFAVLRSPTRIGRLPDNDIVLNDKRVSRHHAELILRTGRWTLRDTGSTNGTAINGKMVKEAALKSGDKLSLGGLEVVWEQ
jgi:pSer/pThr/pTyr-binding forkhead associated (FHA) protein